MSNDKYYLELAIHEAKEAIAHRTHLNEGWFIMYVSKVNREPLIYDRMTDAEKEEYLRLNNLLAEHTINDIEPICKLCLAVYERELPKMIDELQALL